MEKVNKSRFKHRILLASVLFGMLFGAGNLIFPINIGQMAGNKVTIAAFSFMITSIFLPILGVVYCAKSESNSLDELLKPFGKKYARFFNIILLLTIGPLLALPRTATVPYEVGVKLLLPNINHTWGLLIYSFVFFSIALLLALKPNKIKDAIGKVINPIFLFCLFVFFLAFFINPMGSISNVQADPLFIDNAFSSAFSLGYQTMDLLAVLVFTYVVISVNKFEGESDKAEDTKDLLVAGVLSGIMLVVIYYILARIGASSLNIFDASANGGIALGQIFNYYFGSVATAFLVITITLACLKTAIGLIIACGNYFSKITKLSYRQFAVITAMISFLVSNIGLNAIIKYAGPVLSFLYPLAIMHVIYGLIFKNKSTIINRFILVFTMFGASFEVLKDLDIAILNSLIELYNKLPLSNLGFAWINFSIIGLILGIIVNKYVKQRSLK